MTKLWTLLVLAVLACLIAVPAWADLGDELFKLTPSDAEAGARFGYSVGISGHIAIAGSPYDGDDYSGSARLFDVNTGQELFKLTASDAATDDWFGLNVAISGNRAIVGSPNDGAISPLIGGAGAAYLFDVGTGQELFKLTPSDAEAGALFGYSVGISGNLAILGSVGDNHAGDNSGSAYLFDVTTGQTLFKLTASDAATGHRFGGSVAISGNVAIAGAMDEAWNPESGPGAAYLFNAATGQELFKLTASDGAAEDQFGVSVAISGDIAIVGALRDDDAGRNSGSAYLFDITTGQELFKLTASDAAADDLFGVSVAISGNVAIVGSSSDADAGIGSGSAYLFDVTTGLQLAKLTASDAAPNDVFGFSVAISGNAAVIAAAYDDNYRGSAYVFSVVPEPSSLALFILGLPLLVCRNSLRKTERRIP